MSEWEGKERRSANITLGDLLLELRELKVDVKYLVENFSKHTKEDKETFEKISRDQVFVQRIIFGAFGAWAFFQLLISLGIFDMSNRPPHPNNPIGNTSRNDNYPLGTVSSIDGKGKLA